MRILLAMFFLLLALVCVAIGIDALEAGAFTARPFGQTVSQSQTPGAFWATMTVLLVAACALILLALWRRKRSHRGD